jgi:hypothetical protein
MRKSGEINQEFGIYRNVCCGAEIVIPEGVTFPECATHIDLVTQWENITHTDRVLQPRELRPKKPSKGKPAA